MSSLELVVPADLLSCTGPPLRTEQPSQGCNYRVWALTAEQGRFILKTGDRPALLDELEREFQVLRGLEGSGLPVPQAVARQDGYFLFTYLDGEPMTDVIQRLDEAGRHRVAAEFGRALRDLHRYRPASGPQADVLDLALERARANLAAGAEDVTTERVAEWEALRRQYTGDPVFGHADYCLPNVLWLDGAYSGIIDWSGGGWTDRRVDLAAGVWTIGYNLGGGAYTETFLNAYGYEGSEADLTPFIRLWQLV